jgi:hypothetical protein
LPTYRRTLMGRKGRREKEKRVLASRTRATLLVEVL